MSSGPPERDVKDFRFQQLCKFRVSEPLEIRTDRCQWLAASHKFDLIFVGIKDGFKVLKLSDICRVDEENARERSTHIVKDIPLCAQANLSNPISHLTLSCDELTLAVAVKECGNLTLCMYDVRQFAVKTDNPVAFAKSRLNASPGTSLQDLAWNPVDPTLLAVCVSDGSVELIKVTDKIQRVASLPVSCNACCFCWSPKGRQLVVGRKDGTMTQYDQEMKEKRNWPMPTVLQNVHQVVDVTWISTYVFLAAYLPATADSSEQPVIVMTASSKEGPASYVNFEDVCYGSGEERKHKYFFNYLAKWELVMLSSSNATETTVIAKQLDQAGSGVWEHWTLEDSGRAELPLTDDQQDSFPVGVAVSLGCQTQIKLGDNKTHPPSPVMMLLSTDGMLVPYYVMYVNPLAVSLTVGLERLVPADARSPSGSVTTQSSAAPAAMPGYQFGAKKPETTFGSSLPTTGSSFQFVQKTPQPSSAPATTPQTTTQTKGSTQSTIGSSFQFVSKPTQMAPGQNLFAPVGTPPVSSSGAQKVSTPTTSGLFNTPTPATKQPAPTALTGGQGGGNLFSGSAAAASVTTTASKTTSSLGFTFSTTPSVTTAPSTLSSFSITRSGSPSIFGGSSNQTTTTSGNIAGKTSLPAGGAVSQSTKPMGSVVSTVDQSTRLPTSGNSSMNQSAKPTATGIGLQSQPTVDKTAINIKTNESKTAEPPTPTYPVSHPSSQSTVPPPYPGSRPVAQSTPIAHIGSGVAGMKRDIQEEPDRVSPVLTNRSASTAPSLASRQVSTEKPWVNETVESGFTQSIIEEMQHFEQELRELKSRARGGTPLVGTREEMQQLKRNTMEMSTFCQGMKETTRDQSREVDDQRVLCLDLFAMSEECRVRQARNNDPQYHQLLRSRALDPASAETLKRLQGGYQAMEQGLMEVELVLDQQWEAFQDRKKAVKGRLQTPTSDMIYRTVKSNHNLVTAQKTKLENLQEKLKNLQLYNQSSDWQNVSSNSFNSTRSMDLTSLVNSLGQSSTPQPLRTSSMISVSPEKKAQLRDFLSQRPVPRVKSSRPSNLSMSRIIATKGLQEKLDQVRSQSSPQSSQALDPEQTVPLNVDVKHSKALNGLGDGIHQDTRNRAALGQTEDSHAMLYEGQVINPDELRATVGQSQDSPTYLQSFENLSSCCSSEVNSEEQEGLTPGEDDGEESEDEEEDEEEEEDVEGFSPQLADNQLRTHQQGGGTPVSSLSSAGADRKSGIGKNLFGDQTQTSAGGTQTTVAADGLSSVKSGLSGKPLFGSASAQPTPGGPTMQVAKPGTTGMTTGVKQSDGTKPESKGFSFGVKSSEGDSSASFGSKAATTTESKTAAGFNFGAESGIFSKPSDTSKTSSFSAFGGGSFGGRTETGNTSEAAAVKAALNSSLLQALTDSSTTVTSASVTATAALGSSLLAALADASSPAPQEAAAALSSFSFKPGETPPSSNTATSTTTQSAQEVASQSSTTTTTGPTTSSTGGFGQPAKFSGSPPGVTAASTAPKSTPVFGGSGSIFGATGPASFTALTSQTQASPATTATTTSGVAKSLFGTPSTTSATSSGFDTIAAKTTTTTASTLFGGGTAKSATPSLFGAAVTTSKTTSGFGGTTTATPTTATTTTTTAPLFGGATSTTTAAPLFGGATSTTTAAPLFGGVTSTTTAASAFGGTTTTTASLFGSSATTGLFAAKTTTSASASASAFGSPNVSTQSTGFGFGQKTTSGFGQPAFGQAAGFGQTASSFGGSSAGGFGSGGSVFGGNISSGQTPSSSSSSVFGQATTTASSEGGVFGGGGGLFGGLGGKPSADKANKNVFGGGTFGSADKSQNSNLFGSAGGTTSFGTSSTGGFGGSTGSNTGGFTAGGSGVGATGFGISQTPQTPPASAGFGTQPSFGGSPSFGSTAFGGAPTFGSPSGGFGSSAAFSSPVASTTFGSTGQQAGFASFAAGNSPTFGNLAQGSQPSFGSMTQPAGGTGFGSGGGFGSPSTGGFGGQPSFVNQQQSGGFGSSPQFTSYRG